MKSNLKFLSIKLLLLFTVISSAAFGQKKVATNTLLWEIAGKGLSKPSYVFGTYHFAGKDFIDTMNVLNEKLKSVDAVVGELIMNKEEIMKIMPYMMLKDTTLESLFNDKEIEQINAVLLAKLKTNIKAYNSFNPMALHVFLTASFAPIKFDATKGGIDESFQKYAKENNKLVYGLETVDDQGKLIFGISNRLQKETLLHFVNDTAKAIRQGRELYHAYVKQDAEALNRIMEEQEEDSGFRKEEMEALLKTRNEKWLAKLPEMMRKESLFIAVGAGHLFGNDGLIKGLQAKGYKVKPIATN